MGWKPKHKTYFSPREVVARNLGPNSIRYEIAKSNNFNREEDEDYYGDFTPRTLREVRNHNKSLFEEEQEEMSSGIVYGRPTWYSTPKVQKEKKVYTFSAARWSNYSFSSLYSFKSDDDDSSLVIKSPESYITPTAEEIKSKVAVYETKSIHMIKEFCRVCYLKMIDDKDYMSEYCKKNLSDLEVDKSFKEKKQNFDRIYDMYIPGNTPLEQACALYMQIRDKLAKKNAEPNSSFGNSHPSFDREAFSNPIINEMFSKSEYSAQNKLEILNNISVVGKLGAQFIVEREIGEKIVHNSDKHKSKVMNSFEQISKISIYQRLLPNYRAKLYSKNLFVDVPVKSSEKIQKIIILLDYSGSMSNKEKQVWVNAILIDRFKYVIKGEAEVFFSYFVDNTSGLKFHHIKNAKDVDAFWAMFSNYPGGGQTDMGRIVNYVADEIKKKKLHNLKVDLSEEKPEILIINDGQDKVYGTFNYKVNAISLMTLSTQLKNLCIATGGKQVYINSQKNVYAYSSEGDETIFD